MGLDFHNYHDFQQKIRGKIDLWNTLYPRFHVIKKKLMGKFESTKSQMILGNIVCIPELTTNISLKYIACFNCQNLNHSNYNHNSFKKSFT